MLKLQIPKALVFKNTQCAKLNEIYAYVAWLIRNNYKILIKYFLKEMPNYAQKGNKIISTRTFQIK